MDEIEINILIDKIENLSSRLYDEEISTIAASYEVDEILDGLISSRDAAA